MNLEQALLAALIAGVLAVPHCVLMCGPMALASCSRSGVKPRPGSVGYFVGRSVGYSFVGAVVGALGQHALHIVPVDSLQVSLSVALALFCLWRGLKMLRPPRDKPLVTLRRPSLIPLPTQGLALGMASSILPCGALLAAWAIAATSARATTGAAVMFVFSLSSSPGLIATILGRHALRSRMSTWPRSLYAGGWFLLGIMMVSRLWLAATHNHCG